MPDYQLLIFDWDGTLVDSIARIVESMRVAAEQTELPWRDDAAIKGIIGLGLPEAIATLYPELDDARLIDAFRRRYGEHYNALECQPSPLFEGVGEALEAFRSQGYRLAVATGKSRRGLDHVLAGRGWLEYFDVTRCADETASKPDPRMLQEILAHCGVTAERAVMVGDSPFDLRMAHRAGMDCVAVGYGAQSLAELLKESPTLAIERFDELRHWLDGDLNRQSREVELYV
ncbi:HAD-IA family hydrolase [Metapseudomonas resinovorans]|uniref:Putative hydrolase n=1 Tax=Metapseudomonas resinovorans NBRC 106553 TaxID=1245471 RepID=S6AXY5_METRE|nr:HAD-IA family hydrolase [Pseudomonas resinovorans]BAN49531.1 putative hydrolase [Pseudomonas resinovorans NBRC 106553]